MKYFLSTTLLSAGLITLAACGQSTDGAPGTSGAAPAKTPAVETASSAGAGAGGAAASAAEQQTETFTLTVNGMT